MMTSVHRSSPEFGPVGDYAITVLVNGVPRITLPPSGSEEFATTIVLDDLAFALPDKFLTLRADSAVADRHAFTNPVWVRLTRIGD